MLFEQDIDRQVEGQPAVPFLGVLGGHGVGPLAGNGLNEPLLLAVGAGPIGPGADQQQPQGMVSLVECPGRVGRAVVAHHAAELDVLAVESGNCTAEKPEHRWSFTSPRTSTYPMRVASSTAT